MNAVIFYLIAGIISRSGSSGSFFIGPDIFSIEHILFFTGVKGMLEGKDYAATNTVFLFIPAFLDCVTGS